MEWSNLIWTLVGVAIGVGSRPQSRRFRPNLTFSIDLGDVVGCPGQTFRFASVAVSNRRRRLPSNLIDQSADLCTGEIRFIDPSTGDLLFPPMEARWPRYDAEPIDYTTGAQGRGRSHPSS